MKNTFKMLIAIVLALNVAILATGCDDDVDEIEYDDGEIQVDE
jgi:hypothetical protein